MKRKIVSTCRNRESPALQIGETYTPRQYYRGYQMREAIINNGVATYKAIVAEKIGKRTIIAENKVMAKRVIDHRSSGVQN